VCSAKRASRTWRLLARIGKKRIAPSDVGGTLPQSGIYTITHDPAHADMPHEVTVIKGRRFPTCRHCKGISFELAHAAKHVGAVNSTRMIWPRYW
jgi:hypothetical protein